MIKDKIVISVMKRLKEDNLTLYDFIKNNKITNDEIFEMASQLLKQTDDMKNKNTDYTFEFKIKNDKLISIEIPVNPEIKKRDLINKISSMYLFRSFSDDKLLLSMKDDIEQTSTRKELLLTLKKMFNDYPDTKGVYIYGDIGIGKTHIALMVLNKFALEKNKTVAHLLLTEVIARIKSTFGTSTNKFTKIYNSMRDVDVLLIDDIGGEIMSDWSRDELLFPLLNSRLENNKLTLFTSNFSLEQLKTTTKGNISAIKDKRLKDRILALATIIDLKGNNRRK